MERTNTDRLDDQALTELVRAAVYLRGVKPLAPPDWSSAEAASAAEKQLLYHFCRLRLPAVALPPAAFEDHLRRGFELFRRRSLKEQRPAGWERFLEALHAVDWFLACACLEGQNQAWEVLFGARASRTDCLLVDALRLRAVRLFPRDPERQEQSVLDFWGYLLAGQRDGSVAVLARYDGQRPLVPWLIRVFQNKQLTELRHAGDFQALPADDDIGTGDIPLPESADERWHEEFRQAAQDWLQTLSDDDLLILGLRLRYRLSQREVAAQLGVHEGNVSRKTTALAARCHEQIAGHLRSLGWAGDDLEDLIKTEMAGVLLDEPRLSADRLAALLAARGKS
jgi:RNA polymerase sigma factor (sigma-70 family)